MTKQELWYRRRLEYCNPINIVITVFSRYIWWARIFHAPYIFYGGKEAQQWKVLGLTPPYIINIIFICNFQKGKIKFKSQVPAFRPPAGFFNQRNRILFCLNQQAPFRKVILPYCFYCQEIHSPHLTERAGTAVFPLSGNITKNLCF